MYVYVYFFEVVSFLFFAFSIVLRGTIQEVGEVVNKVRMFQFKPDGEVTLRYTQDAHGFPAPVMQDPIHYPHGSAFLAPGPLGLCHPLPDDPHLKKAMTAAAFQHKQIYDSYNLPEEAEPGSVMEKAMKFWKRKQARKQKALEKKLQREKQRIRRTEAAVGADKEEPSSIAKDEEAMKKEEEDFDEDDLIASAPPSGPSVVASVSLGLERAAVAVQQAFHNAAIRAPRLPSFKNGRK